MAALRANPTLMRLARSPLMLTMITSLHDADPGLGPPLTNSRAEFYEQAITHLLRRDHDLGRHRDLARYKAGHKLMALRAVALAAQGAAAHGTDRRVITEQELYAEMSRILHRFGLTERDAPKMVNEIVDRSGLLIRIDENNLLYEFAHLTLQEYLAAVELADAPDRLLELYRENPGRWRETVKLWCGGANRDASTLVGQIFAGDTPDRLLALECVAEARQIDSALAGQIVDSFVAQLGRNIADKHLVLAALGAVAADRDPIGQALFDRLRHKAEGGDWVGDDAIIALAESRRREGIETLSELAIKRPTAREALRATGELAIPVLADRARAGGVAAIDDLAAIGTPAAATAIAEQLWGERPTAVWAAWRLAALIGAPGVEGELAQFDPAPFRRGDGDWYDWLWEPFPSAADGRQTILVTMGRVGWLLDTCDDAEVPTDLGNIDTRLALGLGARRDSFKSLTKIPVELEQEIAEAAHQFGYQSRHWVESISDLEFHWENSAAILDLIADKHPETARMFASRLNALRTPDARRALLLNHLPTPLLVDLAKRLWTRSYSQVPLEAGIQDWRTLDERPEPPRLLLVVRNTVSTLAVLLGLGAAGIALTRSVGTLIGWWSWGPRWFAAAILLTVAIAIGAAIYEGNFIPETGAYEVTAAIAGVLACVGALIVALSTAAGWLGWLATISIVVLAVGSVTLFSIWTSRRERALRNPYRALLQLDARTALDGATVIARHLANGGRVAAPSGTEAPPPSAPLTPATRSQNPR
jgi:hypothetical protein